MKLCKRTFCIWCPGEPMPGVVCLYKWSGSIPCTGTRVCFMCGEPMPAEKAAKQ